MKEKDEVAENVQVEDNAQTEDVALVSDEISLANNNAIKIADDVVAVIAGVAVSEIPGVADMAGGFAGGITEVLSGKKNPDVAYEIQTKVKKAVETMTGLKVVEVNVHVQGVNISTTNNNGEKNVEQ